MKKSILALIPARMGSSRFPGKPMALINGTPMIGHVYKNVSLADKLTICAVATCDQEIFDYITSIGGIAVMTSKSHERASDRCAEALLKLEKSINTKFEIVVMVQGDEPMTTASMIDEAIDPFYKISDINVVNLMAEIDSEEEFNDRNCIKVVVDKNSDALYFSREPIPTGSKGVIIKRFKQVCVIPFKRDYLLRYTNLPVTAIENAESVDMMRILENGEKVKMVYTKSKSYSVDTPEDLVKVSKMM